MSKITQKWPKNKANLSVALDHGEHSSPLQPENKANLSVALGHGEQFAATAENKANFV